MREVCGAVSGMTLAASALRGYNDPKAGPEKTDTYAMIQELAGRHALDSAEGRAAFVHEAAPLVTRIAAPLLKLQVVKSVAETAGMTQGEVEFAFEQL